MNTRSVEVRLVADVRGFVEAMRKVVCGMQPYLDARQGRLQRMHSAYGRKRGRGRW